MDAAPVGQSRHIKCDETPNACRNCTSTGRKCDGYTQYRLPSRKVTLPVSKPSKSLILGLPGLDSDERRCLQFFEHNTIPMLVGYADSEVWQRLVLQMCHREPAVCHAVVALSAFHEDYERSIKTLKSKPDHRHHHFALEQYNRSMAMLRRRIQSNDPQVRGITLMCCITFIILELLEGDYTNAFAHLQQGLNILKTQSANHALTTERILAKAFLQLNTPRAYWNGPDVVVTGHPPKGSVSEVAYEITPIYSIAEAKERLRVLMNNIFHLQSLCNLFFRGEQDPALNSLTLSAKQTTLHHDLTDFTLDLKSFISSHKSNNTAWTLRETRSVDVILTHVATLTSMLGCSLDTTELGYDNFLPEFKRINHLCERIIATFVTEYGSYENLPTMVTDIGVLPSLFWCCVRCRDAETRERALHLLKVWPHREGFYDSYLIVNICRGLIDIEDEGRDAEGFIPRESRVHTHTIEVAEDRRSMVIRYVLAGGGGEEQERVVVLE
ncbi:hypothetical protein ASPFODRAFT_59007 [Aspergillus luchuensis CBS 106.47]|uniref:Zn(2)-C6 fungal-type domain-containing protein n=1 Tax=Aspergillus luchuensis (strain CBS 106.47) TaxID=1137211 RepID=A0A1M3TMY4_ASPLC|nr:hypothetical protein ASPFODRAFT_59007 [Aspergillus luchuensis CBS 106.47]